MSQSNSVISLGAGVQSTTLALMAADGRWGTVPSLAIFADTQHEPSAIYEHLDWLERELAGRIEVVRVTAGDLLDIALGRRFNPIPLYLANANGTASAGRRQCTKEFKLYPIRHELRRRGLNDVEMWVGISLDETVRMKPTGLQWVRNRWPLIEHRLTRHDCATWFAERYPRRTLAKSACIFCPYKSARDWSQMRRTDPESFERACAADEAMRYVPGGGEQFVSSQLVPLARVRTIEDDGQLTIFDAECEGMCGV
jgi:hypothetical protein